MRLRTSLFLHLLPLGLLVATALLVTLPLTSALEAGLVGPPSVEPAPRPPAEPGRAPLEEPRLRALLGLPAPSLAVDAPVARSTSPFAGRLLGTLSSSLRERSVATILLPSGRARSVWEGDQVLDAEVLEIERQAVVLRRHGVTERLELHPPPAIASTTLVQPLVTTVSANDFTVSRAEVLSRMSDLYALSRGVRVTPAFRDGLPIGFRFAGVAPDSAAATLGLQSGDVIRRVNGRPIDSMQQILALAASLEHLPQVDLELERAGQVVTHRYRLN